MRWQSTVTFTNWKKYNYISLPGTMLKVQLKKAKKMADTVLKVAWINDIYKLYFPLLFHRNKKSCPTVESQFSGPKLWGRYISVDQIIKNKSDYLWRRCSFQINSPGRKETREYILFDRYVLSFIVFRGEPEELIGPSQRYFPPKRYLTSWNGASALCRSYGMYLPYFYSREELEEFIAILKLSNSVPPLEGIYIGIKTVNRNKVGDLWRDSLINK